MDIKPATVCAWNETHGQLMLSDSRIDELPIELGQLRAAMANIRGKVDFDTDPFDFRVALIETAEKEAKV